MSKFRTWALGSKYRLGKELADYKQNRIARRRCGAGYVAEANLDLVPHKTKKRSGYCKAMKGEHDFQPCEIKKFSFWPGTVRTYKCSGCGKENYEWDRTYLKE